MVKLNTEGFKANAQHVAGIVLGKLVLRPLGLRFGKEHRGQHTMFSHVAANLAADGIPQALCPFVVFYRKA